jgi:hypothetical protein
MKRICTGCEERSVYVLSVHGYGSSKCVESHDLCGRCYRRLRNQIVAKRMMPKPEWAERARSTLFIHGIEDIHRWQAAQAGNG